ncbi:Tubulin/FtsZ, GTPase domain-containing protein [Piptocephalis cylindrospora]|uniref:Tubulin/FtsZ, GTPase domain-containing protein n=1 Tax=Piptocephalis cylindrospora TaxID=1907219 RepID=A0A4P9XY32_9FUNG|nr:Tubulin/FtsZ, GTPase domain-containing protein [Piptocephalis cylindrospora]|eukprot:RKP11363.1 Tubulin/FtsZ, GTPase domain-containing protein [Piptocephalis cylindrospora]
MATDTKEIITLQVGPEAGWVGTAFWNAQDPTEDTPGRANMFRECAPKTLRGGARSSGVAYAPRALVLDYARNLGSLDELVRATPDEEAEMLKRKQGTEEEQWTTPAWGEEGKRQVVHRSTSAHSTSPSLRERIQREHGIPRDILHGKGMVHWPDLLMAPISPFSLSVVPPSAPMSHGSDGETWMRGEEQVETVLEGKLRHLMEEADAPQGFQVLASAGNGWGGVAYSLLDHLAEEYPRLGRIYLPLLPGPEAPGMDPLLSPCHSLVSMMNALSTDTLLLPMAFGGSTDGVSAHPPDSPIRLYEQGSTIGMALDLLSRTYREDGGRMSDIFNYFSRQQAQPVLQTSLSMDWASSKGKGYALYPQSLLPIPSSIPGMRSNAKISILATDSPVSNVEDWLKKSLGDRELYPSFQHHHIQLPSPYRLSPTFPLCPPHRLVCKAQEVGSALVEMTVGGRGMRNWARDLVAPTKDLRTRLRYASVPGEEEDVLKEAQESMISWSETCASEDDWLDSE